MFGHDDVAEHQESVPPTCLFESIFELGSTKGGSEFRLTSITTEGDEVVATEMLVTREVGRHG